MTVIAGVDLGQTCGIAVGLANEKPRLLSKELPKGMGAGASDFEVFVRSVIVEYDVEVLAWERPFIALARGRAGGSVLDAQGEVRTQRLYGQAFICTKLAHDYGLRTYREFPHKVRKSLVGNGRASEEQIMQFAHSCGMKPSCDHEADAFIIWKAAHG